MERKIRVIGAGLSGSEAALKIAESGFFVELFEMRPQIKTEAHTTCFFSELVCSNSFGGERPCQASWLLKEELKRFNSTLFNIALECRVPSGTSLSVDRNLFSKKVTEKILSHPNIRTVIGEVTEIPIDGITIVATGPLTSQKLCHSISRLLGQKNLYFYDAISPIVSSEGLDYDVLFWQNRYSDGEDFLNIPLNEKEYKEFVSLLKNAETVPLLPFEDARYFESCLPIEVMAKRGENTLLFGPMKSVGLIDPRNLKRPYAVIQLRAENRERTAFNMVGFQTKLTYKEQKRIFSQLPGLKEAEFLRFGSLHRNTYINSPQVLKPTLQLSSHDNIFISGQLCGSEGYLEAIATGLIAGVNTVRLIENKTPLVIPSHTMIGALINSITSFKKRDFQPVNANFGLFPTLKKKERTPQYFDRKLQELTSWLSSI